MPLDSRAVIFGTITALFLLAFLLWTPLKRISYRTFAAICAVATVGTIIWAAALGLWWGVLMAGVCLLPITHTWWAERGPGNQK